MWFGASDISLDRAFERAPRAKAARKGNRGKGIQAKAEKRAKKKAKDNAKAAAKMATEDAGRTSRASKRSITVKELV